MTLNGVDSAGISPGGNSGVGGRKRKISLLVLTGVWLAVIGLCMGLIERYTAAPGDAGTPPGQWPAASRIPLDPQRPTLVLFAHPQCPCTEATMGELNQLMSRVPGRVSAQVWFLKPENTAAGWTNTSLWRAAAAIPGVTVHEDRAGFEAGLFHAQTSGQTLLYGPDGRLMFQGGITIARGHAGDNPGRSALADLVTGQLTNRVQTPVYGCSLFDKQCRAPGSILTP